MRRKREMLISSLSFAAGLLFPVASILVALAHH